MALYLVWLISGSDVVVIARVHRGVLVSWASFSWVLNALVYSRNRSWSQNDCPINLPCLPKGRQFACDCTVASLYSLCKGLQCDSHKPVLVTKRALRLAT